MVEEADERSHGRAQAEAQRRRRRGDEALSAAKRLPIPPEVEARLARDGLVPRWANDEGNRIHRLTKQDDYDFVEGVEPVPVGTAPNGAPIMAHLLAKPRTFIEEDRLNAEQRRRETEEALFRKADEAHAVAAGTNPNNPAVRPASSTYVAEGTKIGRGNQVLDD